jgi:hypothetical protein
MIEEWTALARAGAEAIRAGFEAYAGEGARVPRPAPNRV